MSQDVKHSSENVWVSLVANIAIPALLLSKGSKWFPQFSPVFILLVALAFPCAYFIFDYFRRREVNFISILGFAGTLLSGGVGLFQLSPFWVAVKEAAIPSLIAVALIVSRKMGNKFLFNEKIFDIPAIDNAVESNGTRRDLEKTLRRSSWLLVASFILSAVLNFGLARWIVQTDPAQNPEVFNEELGKMMAFSYPVIVLPCMVFIAVALWLLIAGLKKATGMPLEKMLKARK